MMLLQRGASIDVDVIFKAPKPSKKGEDDETKPAWKFNPLGTKAKVEDRKYPLFQVGFKPQNLDDMKQTL